MPRDGSGVYSRLPGTDAITDTTIESSKYNSNVADVEFDLNYPRPIVAGGTGAINADQALANLSGEKAKQIVTNWDSMVWMPGSFYAVAATGISPIGTVPPTAAHAFAGIAYYANATDFVTEAVDLTTGIRYLRIMTAGVWSPWLATGSTQYVLKAGDTMTGTLGIAPAAAEAQLNLAAPAGSYAARIYGYKAGQTRWLIAPVDGSAETGSNAGSNFQITAYNDAGAPIGNALTFNRADLAATIGGSLTVGGQIFSNSIITSRPTATTGSYYFGASGTKHLDYDGTNFVFNGGGLIGPTSFTANGPIFSVLTATTGSYYFGSGGTKYLNYDGTSFNLNGGPLWVAGDVYSNRAANQGYHFFGSNQLQYLGYNGTEWIMAGAGRLNLANIAGAGSNAMCMTGTLRVGTGSSSGLPENIFSYFSGVSMWGSLFQDYGGGASAGVCMFYKGGTSVGSIQITASGTSYGTTSDLALKEAVSDYDASEAVRIIRADPVRTWNWKATGQSGMGWVAQYSHAVDPDLAVPPVDMVMPKGEEPPEQFWSIDYGKRTPYLWAAVSSLLDRIDVLEAKLAALETK